jgi:hypothetical protein
MLTFFSGSNNSESFLYVYFLHALRNAPTLSSRACGICLSLDVDAHGKIPGDVRLKMGGTGEIPAELWEVSEEPGDELTVFGASYCSRDTHKDLHFVDELCSLEVPAFWKKSIHTIKFKRKAFQIKREAHKYLFLQTTLLLLLLLLKAVQLQRSFGLLNEFFPFGPVSDAVLPIYFRFCYIAFYIILPPIFRSS